MTRAAGIGLIAAALLSTACGSRTGLAEGGTRNPGNDAGSEAGSDAAVDPCAAPDVPAACAQSIASAPPGTEVWNTGFDLGALDLLGPVAADTAGTTYYLAAEQALYVKTVYALDACGALRWKSDVSNLVAASGYVTQVMVAGSHLLVVGVGSIVALDLETGAHVWTADLAGFAEGGGLGVPPGKVVAMGFAAARADGTAYSVIANDLDAWIVSVSSAGAVHPVGKVSHYLGGIGYPLDTQQLVIDAVGDVVLAGGSNPGSGDRIDAFTPSGKSAFSTTLPSWGNGQFLAAGPDYVTGEALWILNLDGTLRNSFVGGGPTFVSWDGPTVIDAHGTLFAAGGQHLDPGVSTVTYDLLGGFAPDGSKQWGVTLDEPVASGPLLGDDDRVFLVTSASYDPGSPMHLAAYGVDGSLAWRHELPSSGKTPSYWLLQNAAGALTLTIDNRVHAFASGGSKPPSCALWPTPRGDLGQRVCAFGT